MGKPPAGVNPEHFVLAREGYSNTRVSRVVSDDEQFRIEPAPTGWCYLVVANAIFIAFFVGFAFFIRRFANANFPLAAVLCLVVGLMTCGLFTALVLGDYRREQRRGTWLIYDKKTRSVTLPRVSETFVFDEIVHLQYVSTKDLGQGTITDNPANSELNLVTLRGGRRER